MRFLFTPLRPAVRLCPECKFLTLACDGVWDVFDDQEAIEFVAKALESNVRRVMSKELWIISTGGGFVCHRVSRKLPEVGMISVPFFFLCGILFSLVFFCFNQGYRDGDGL